MAGNIVISVFESHPSLTDAQLNAIASYSASSMKTYNSEYVSIITSKILASALKNGATLESAIELADAKGDEILITYKQAHQQAFESGASTEVQYIARDAAVEALNRGLTPTAALVAGKAVSLLYSTHSVVDENTLFRIAKIAADAIERE